MCPHGNGLSAIRQIGCNRVSRASKPALSAHGGGISRARRLGARCRQAAQLSSARRVLERHGARRRVSGSDSLSDVIRRHSHDAGRALRSHVRVRADAVHQRASRRSDSPVIAVVAVVLVVIISLRPEGPLAAPCKPRCSAAKRCRLPTPLACNGSRHSNPRSSPHRMRQTCLARPGRHPTVE